MESFYFFLSNLGIDGPHAPFFLYAELFLARTKGRIPLNKSIFSQKRSGDIGNFFALIPECLKTILFFRNLGNWGMDVFFLLPLLLQPTHFPDSPHHKKPDDIHPLKLLCRDCKEFGAVFLKKNIFTYFDTFFSWVLEKLFSVNNKLFNRQCLVFLGTPCFPSIHTTTRHTREFDWPTFR